MKLLGKLGLMGAIVLVVWAWVVMAFPGAKDLQFMYMMEDPSKFLVIEPFGPIAVFKASDLISVIVGSNRPWPWGANVIHLDEIRIDNRSYVNPRRLNSAMPVGPDSDIPQLTPGVHIIVAKGECTICRPAKDPIWGAETTDCSYRKFVLWNLVIALP